MSKDNNDSKTKFIKDIMSMSRDEIEDFIASKGKPRKLIRPAIIVRK